MSILFQLHGKSVMEYLNDKFDGAMYRKCDTYMVGTILHTAVSRQWTNATIVGGLPDGKFMVLTDIGNFLELTVQDMQTMYLPPVCRRTNNIEVLDWTEVYP